MEKKYVLALDQGTTSSRAIIFDKDQKIVAMAQKEFTQHYPKEGWVEHDAVEIYSSQYGVMIEAIVKSGINVEEIAGIGITNQRETTVLWEKDTGIQLSVLNADGGASRDAFLMQFQADILDKKVQRPIVKETTALGAAYLAGLATGLWNSRDELKTGDWCDTVFTPDMDSDRREKLVKGWHKAVGRSLDWAEH